MALPLKEFHGIFERQLDSDVVDLAHVSIQLVVSDHVGRAIIDDLARRQTPRFPPEDVIHAWSSGRFRPKVQHPLERPRDHA